MRGIPRRPITDGYFVHLVKLRANLIGHYQRAGHCRRISAAVIVVDDHKEFLAASRETNQCALLASLAGSLTPATDQRHITKRLLFRNMRCNKQGDLREAAANFFRMLRELDAKSRSNCGRTCAGEGIGAAINDRCDARDELAVSSVVRRSRNLKAFSGSSTSLRMIIGSPLL